MSPIQQLLLGTGAASGSSDGPYVEDDLVFHLDPANTNCYSGSGTTVNSLVNSHTSEHFGDITWSSDSGGTTGGYFEYDGTQDTGLQFPYSTDFEFTKHGSTDIDDYSWELWWYGDDELPRTGNLIEAYIYFAKVSTTGRMTGSGGLYASNEGAYMIYRVVLGNAGETNGTVYHKNGSPGSLQKFDEVSWTGSKWQHYVFVKDSTSWTMYVDGSSLSSFTRSYLHFSNTSKKLLISGRFGSFKASIRLGVMRFYQGKALTATEVEQNYDAERSRYGH